MGRVQIRQNYNFTSIQTCIGFRTIAIKVLVTVYELTKFDSI
jgi:hypothetical protein